MEEGKLSAEDSLLIIQNMIGKAKMAVADSSFYFLLWGWLVFVACIGQYILKVIFLWPYHPIVWTLVFVGIVVSAIHGIREGKRSGVKTYIGDSLAYLWFGITVSYIVFGFAFSRIGWQYCYTFYMLLYALGCFVTGRSLKFPPLVWGAIGSWLLAVVSLFTSFDLNILICAFAILISYIIPGHLLRIQFLKQKK